MSGDSLCCHNLGLEQPVYSEYWQRMVVNILPHPGYPHTANHNQMIYSAKVEELLCFTRAMKVSDIEIHF
jgi:hypothetical protein